MTANDTARPSLPEGRYGRPPRRGRRLATITALTAVGAAAAAWLGWVAWYYANPSVHATLLRYEVITQSTVEITFELVKDPDVGAGCVVSARNESGEEVGRRTIRVPAGGPRRRLVTETLATRDTAILGEVRECRTLP